MTFNKVVIKPTMCKNIKKQTKKPIKNNKKSGPKHKKHPKKHPKKSIHIKNLIKTIKNKKKWQQL
mgnify:CR=1 FL=1